MHIINRGDYMYTIYQIMPGDTMNNLAMKFGTSMEELRRINSLPFNYDFTVGEQIIVPNNTNPFLYYTVKKGDSLYALSQKYNVDIDTILKINGLSKTDTIYPNEQILIPQSNVNLYIVEEGDTLKDISNKSNRDIQTLLENNEMLYLLPGQLIIIDK